MLHRVIICLLLSISISAQAGPLEDFKAAAEAIDRGDYVAAYRLFNSVAQQGFPGGHYGLGAMYLEGKGVPQSYSEAMRRYRLAAEKDHFLAQFEIGALYDRGLGVQQDRAEAARWFRRSAEHGYSRAQFNLALMYAGGEGVSRDDVQALKWLELALSNARPQDVTSFTSSRATLTRRMTPTQISEGQRLAQEWRASKAR
jgi:hypothetical protein